MFSFDEKKVDLTKELGNGTFGTVYRYQSKKAPDAWVVKVLTAKKMEEFMMQIQEIALGFSLDHPNVLPIKGFYIKWRENHWNTYLKIPRMTGSLKSRIMKNKSKREHFQEKEVAQYFYDLVCGIQYLHDRGIAHCDIKPSNILVDDKENKLKIGDIGIAKYVGDETSYELGGFGGTQSYSAPEIVARDPTLKKKDLFKADIWSLGIVMTEICLLEEKVIENSGPDEKSGNALAKRMEILEKKGYSDILIKLISGLLRWDPSSRSSLKEVKELLLQNYPNLIKVDEPRKVAQKSSKEKSLAALKKVDQEVQTEFVEEIIEKPSVEIIDGYDIPDISNQDLSDKISIFKLSWEKDFKMLIDFPKSIKVQKANEQVSDSDLTNWIDEFIQIHSPEEQKEADSFEINLMGCPQVTDKGVTGLVESIGSNFKNLSDLKLQFGENFLLDQWREMQITDLGLNSLAEIIGSYLKNIQQLMLGFPCCLKITDEGVQNLSEVMGTKLRTIQKLELDFKGCEQITDDAIYKLSHEIKSNLKNIQDFKIYLGGTSVTPEAREYMKELCNFIPKFEILDF